MELDDLKKAWAEQPAEPLEPLEWRQIERQFSKKTDGLRRSLFFEMAAVGAMLALVAWAWFFGSIYRGLTVKMLIFGAAAWAGLTFWRLFRAIKKLETGHDFSGKVIENLRTALADTERELRIYRWSAWIFFAFMFVVLCFDKWFWGMNLNVKTLLLGVLAFSALTTRPYLDWLYGRKIRAIRQQLDAFLSENEEK